MRDGEVVRLRRRLHNELARAELTGDDPSSEQGHEPIPVEPEIPSLRPRQHPALSTGKGHQSIEACDGRGRRWSQERTVRVRRAPPANLPKARLLP